MNYKTTISVGTLFCSAAFFLSVSFSIYAQESDVQTDQQSYVLKTELSDEQRAQCLEKAKLAAQMVTPLSEALKKLETLKINLDALLHEQNIKGLQLDLHSEHSVNEYNQLNSKINQLSREYQLKANNYNLSVEQYQADILQLKNSCLESRSNKS